MNELLELLMTQGHYAVDGDVPAHDDDCRLCSLAILLSQVPFSPCRARLEEVERRAVVKHDGCLTIMRFATGWKVMFDTPEMTQEGRAEVWHLPAYDTAEEALRRALMTDVVLKGKSP